MSLKFEEGKDAIIDAIIQKSPSGKHSVNHDIYSVFVRQFYATVAVEDLKDMSVDELHGAAINFINFMNHRALKETKIHIYNPEFERHGWQSTHTIIEVICDDMPFLVDSIRMILARMHISSYLIIHMGGLHVERNGADEVVRLMPRHALPKDHLTLEAPILVEI